MRDQPQGADREEGRHRRGQAGAALRHEQDQERYAPDPVVGPADGRDEERGAGREEDTTGLAVRTSREPQPGGGDEDCGHGPDGPWMRVVRHAGDQPLQRLVVDDPRLADAARLVEPVGPEVDAGGGQRERAERDGAGEGGGGGEPLAYASGDQEIRDEDRRGELDPGGDPDPEAFADGAGGPGQIPEDEAGEGEVDLPEDDRLEDGLDPDPEGGGREEGGDAGGEPGEAAGEVDEEREERDVPHDEGELEGGEGEPGGGYKEEGGEGWIGGRQVPPGDGEPVEIAPPDDGGAFGPVDEGVGHGNPKYQAEGCQPDERNPQKPDRPLHTPHPTTHRQCHHAPDPSGSPPKPLPPTRPITPQRATRKGQRRAKSPARQEPRRGVSGGRVEEACSARVRTRGNGRVGGRGPAREEKAWQGRARPA